MRISMFFQKPNPFPKASFENLAYGFACPGGKAQAKSSPF
jgi:ABC-type phosphate transport system ATPase subunit